MENKLFPACIIVGVAIFGCFSHLIFEKRRIHQYVEEWPLAKETWKRVYVYGCITHMNSSPNELKAVLSLLEQHKLLISKKHGMYIAYTPLSWFKRPYFIKLKRNNDNVLTIYIRDAQFVARMSALGQNNYASAISRLCDEIVAVFSGGEVRIEMGYGPLIQLKNKMEVVKIEKKDRQLKCEAMKSDL